MKRITTILMVTLVSAVVVGCNGTETKTSKNENKTTKVKNQESSDLKVVDPAPKSKEKVDSKVEVKVGPSVEVKAAPNVEVKALPKVESKASGDWTMWGGTINRNMVNSTTGINIGFDPATGKNILWTANLGSQTYGNPVVGMGKILVGTNNGAGYRPKHPTAEDRGVVLCFDEKTGKFLWQLTRKKLPIGRVSDWPLQGICSCPLR